MEGDNGEQNNNTSVGAASSGGAPATSSRWNPTKEQINMLEGFYSQGIRTPSAEQIKQITSRLKAFGHIEGKNVFYWFQNHKARQRQKQKQEHMAYINRFLQRNNTTQPIFPVPSHHHLPCPNVVCGPYYLSVGAQIDHHQQHHPKVPPISNGGRRRPPEKISAATICSAAGSGYEPADQGEFNFNYNYNNKLIMMNNNSSCDQETLPLFPLSPTGILKAGQEENPCNFDSESPTISYGSSAPCSSSVVEEGCSKSADLDHQPFYDFL